MDIREAVRIFYGRKKLRQKDFAKKLSINPNSFSSIMKGSYNFSKECKENFEKVYGFPFDDLPAYVAGKQTVKHAKPDKDARLIEALKAVKKLEKILSGEKTVEKAKELGITVEELADVGANDYSPVRKAVGNVSEDLGEYKEIPEKPSAEYQEYANKMLVIFGHKKYKEMLKMYIDQFPEERRKEQMEYKPAERRWPVHIYKIFLPGHKPVSKPRAKSAEGKEVLKQ